MSRHQPGQTVTLGTMPSSHNSTESKLIPLAATGDAVAIEKLVMLHRDRLKRMILARMDSRLVRRMEPSDVIQEVHV